MCGENISCFYFINSPTPLLKVGSVKLFGPKRNWCELEKLLLSSSVSIFAMKIRSFRPNFRATNENFSVMIFTDSESGENGMAKENYVKNSFYTRNQIYSWTILQSEGKKACHDLVLWQKSSLSLWTRREMIRVEFKGEFYLVKIQFHVYPQRDDLEVNM